MAKRKSNKKAASRIGWFVLAFVLLFLAFVSKDKLPASWQENQTVIDVYAKRDALMARIAPAEKPVSSEKTVEPETTPGQGYADDVRGKMDKLISKGAEDH